MQHKIENAKIIGTFLGIEDHGFFTATVLLDYGGIRQSFGGHDLTYTSYQTSYLRKILETVGIEKWEDLTGKHIRADHSHTKVLGIGNIIEDRWFYPEGKEGEDPQ